MVIDTQAHVTAPKSLYVYKAGLLIEAFDWLSAAKKAFKLGVSQGASA
jgi:hypothetical protein